MHGGSMCSASGEGLLLGAHVLSCMTKSVSVSLFL